MRRIPRSRLDNFYEYDQENPTSTAEITRPISDHKLACSSNNAMPFIVQLPLDAFYRSDAGGENLD